MNKGNKVRDQKEEEKENNDMNERDMYDFENKNQY